MQNMHSDGWEVHIVFEREWVEQWRRDMHSMHERECME